MASRTKPVSISLAVLVVAGCLGPGAGPASPTHTTSATATAPAWHEPERERAALARDLEAISAAVATTCGAPPPPPIEDGEYAIRINILFGACQAETRRQLQLAEQDRSPEALAAQHDTWRARAEQAVANTTRRLDGFGWNGTAVQAEALAVLMDHSVWERDTLATARILYDNYTESGLFHSYHNAMLNLVGRAVEERIWPHFERLAHPPDRSCTPPAAAFVSRERSGVEHIVERMPDDRRLNSLEGRARYDLIPASRIYEERGWWPGVQAADTGLEWIRLALANNGTAERAAYTRAVWLDSLTQNVRDLRAGEALDPVTADLWATHSGLEFRFSWPCSAEPTLARTR